MARILNPDAGTIHTDGKISALLELGAGFHPELSGRENVYLNGAILGLSRKQLNARFDDIVDFAGLEHFIDTPVKNYSSGMYVRLGFSVAINVDPDILLVDEVLAVGDEEFQRRCTEKFAELKHSGKTVVIVSHALGSVRNLCDEVALLEHGKLLAVGPAGEVIDDYLADVHVDRVKDGEYGSRWGSGEGKIEKVELLGPDGAPADEIHTGGPAHPAPALRHERADPAAGVRRGDPDARGLHRDRAQHPPGRRGAGPAERHRPRRPAGRPADARARHLRPERVALRLLVLPRVRLPVPHAAVRRPARGPGRRARRDGARRLLGRCREAGAPVSETNTVDPRVIDPRLELPFDQYQRYQVTASCSRASRCRRARSCSRSAAARARSRRSCPSTS